MEYPSQTPEARAKHREEMKAKSLEYLGGVCTKCGATENLEFDHINPEDVSFRIGARFNKSWASIKKELDKCQLLCNSCHWEKTRKERGLNQPAHGTTSYYQNYGCRCIECKASWAEYKRRYNSGYLSTYA